MVNDLIIKNSIFKPSSNLLKKFLEKSSQASKCLRTFATDEPEFRNVLHNIWTTIHVGTDTGFKGGNILLSRS